MKHSKYYPFVLLLLAPLIMGTHILTDGGWMVGGGFLMLMGIGGFVVRRIVRRR